MSIFGTIMSKIFNHGAAASPAPLPDQTAAPAQPAASTPATPTSSAPAATPAQPVDVGAVLADLAANQNEPLNYQTSIVDLMKLLGLDSSLQNRKELATELHYTGDENDSAAMNIWLHKQVMDKLAENGGTVPAELRA